MNSFFVYNGMKIFQGLFYFPKTVVFQFLAQPKVNYSISEVHLPAAACKQLQANIKTCTAS